MKELKSICSAAENMQSKGFKVAMATVVGVRGSAYRRPGARMIVSKEGQSFGMIGGGCFDADVKEMALEVISTGKPRLRLYEMADDHVWGLGLGCNGSVYVLIESLEVELGQQWLAHVKQTFQSGKGLGVQHQFSRPLDYNFGEENDEVHIQRTYTEVHSKFTRNHHEKSIGTFEEWIEPAPRLLIFGAGHDAIPVVEFASQAGFDVTVIDQRASFLNRDRFPHAEDFIHARPEEYEEKLHLLLGDYVLFMTHRIDFDAAAFQFCYQKPVKYLGFLGPKRRAEKIMTEMLQIDSMSLNPIRSRIFAPIGVDLGAETAEEVALSIVAELMAVKNNRIPQSLRDKNGNIHDDTVLKNKQFKEIEGNRKIKRGTLACSL